MARIRTIKPSFWSDEKVSLLTREERLLYIGLISMADDEGRFPASPTAIAGYAFPFDELPNNRVRKWRDKLAEVALIEIYEAGGLEYGVIPKFRKHQRINRPSPSQLPEVPLFHDGSMSRDGRKS